MLTRRTTRLLACLLMAVLLVAAGCERGTGRGAAPVKTLSTGESSSPRDITKVPGDDRPNIVFFLTDDQSLEEMSVMPQTRRLIGDTGATFSHAVAQYPLCCPTRASLMTGQMAHNHGVLGNEPPWGGYTFFDPKHTVPSWLQGAGYRTAIVGKWFNGYPVAGKETHVDPGWDDWYVPTIGAYNYRQFQVNENGSIVRHRQYQTEWQADTMSTLAEKYSDEDVPFFIYGAFLAPHYGGPEEPDDPQRTQTPSVADKYRDTVDDTIPDKPNRPEADMSDKNRWWFQGRKAQPDYKLNAIYQQRRESLKSVDDAVTQVVSKLRDLGELDNTLLVFASDNGYFIGEHGLVNQKIFGYEESIRVPLLMSGPGIPAGIRRDQLVSLVDLPRTFLELAGVKPGLTQDGLSLMPFVDDPSYRSGRHLLLESGGWPRPEEDRMYTGIRGPNGEVLLRYWNGHTETYDVTTDPYQLDGRTSRAERAWRGRLLRMLDDLEDCVGEDCSKY